MSGLHGLDLLIDEQVRHHKNNAHRTEHHSRHTQPFEVCWDCGRLRAICHTKRRHDTIDAAQQHCDDVNRPSDLRPLVPYRCPWSGGEHYHARSSDGSSDRRRARKRMVKLTMKDPTRWDE